MYNNMFRSRWYMPIFGTWQPLTVLERYAQWSHHHLIFFSYSALFLGLMMHLEVAPSWILTYILAFLCWVIQCCRPQFPTDLRACVCRTFVVGYSTKLMMDGMQCQKPRASQGKGAVALSSPTETYCVIVDINHACIEDEKRRRGYL